MKPRKRVGEVAGGATAECAAICCCCPFTVMNLLVLAMYKVPKGLCKKAWIKRQKRQRTRRQQAGGGSTTPCLADQEAAETVRGDVEKSEALSKNEEDDLEKEMWNRFLGFWRSPSQREAV
ncbi:hypothetical protein RJ641_008204 [Dillenia turbinata]|uniref:Uncharacterized protein n=1 Tax=Dillenia turbinata TaxID=194707 RepID=A0AAN8V2S8_9MAGN